VDVLGAELVDELEDAGGDGGLAVGGDVSVGEKGSLPVRTERDRDGLRGGLNSLG
jgi:hypothetical protein